MKLYLFLMSAAVSLMFSSCVDNPPLTSNGSGAYGNSYSARFNTNFSEDWDSWVFQVGDTTGYIRTAFSEDWDNWDFNIDGYTGDIRTAFSEDWDNWDLTHSGATISIETNFSNDFDNWKIYDPSTGTTIRVRTAFSSDWDNWDVTINGNHILDVRTNFSNDFDNWRVYGDMDQLTNIQKVAVMFVPLFAGGLYSQDIQND